jgi:hypothetical protein
MKIQIRAVDENGRVFSGEFDLVETKLAVSKGPVRQDVDIALPKKKAKPSLAVETLYRAGFFSVAKSLGEVVKQVSLKLGYNFDSASILMSMKAAPYLLRRGSKGSYIFIQKYPPEHHG